MSLHDLAGTTTIPGTGPGPLQVKEVSFKTFWARSRFAGKGGATAKGITRQTYDGIAATPGGLVSFIECTTASGSFAGNIVVFFDPAYHSHGRRGIGCFGLVTATTMDALHALLRTAKDTLGAAGIATMRGPVNVPRFLFGYGLQSGGFDKPAISGVSVDPPLLVDWFDAACDAGELVIATRYEGWSFDTARTGPACQARAASLEAAGARLVHPDFDTPGDLPGKLSSLFNESMGTRPDGFDMTPDMIGGYVSIYKMVPGGERLLGFLLDDRDDLAGAIIMQPDWFQALAGKPITGLACDTIAITRAHRGKGLSVAFFQACAAAVDHFQPAWFEYVYTVPGNLATNSLTATMTVPAKAFVVFEGGTG